MRARLGFAVLPLGWWEAETEVMERFRGFGGGGEDIVIL